MFTDMLWMVLLLCLILVIVVANVWGRRVGQRQKAREQADKERFSRWKCPTCDQEYGEDVHYVRYGKPMPLTMADRVFTPDVIVICQRCQYMNVFDSAGKHDPAFSSLLPMEQAID